jgi:CarD family transcriptional regulator
MAAKQVVIKGKSATHADKGKETAKPGAQPASAKAPATNAAAKPAPTKALKPAQVASKVPSSKGKATPMSASTKSTAKPVAKVAPAKAAAVKAPAAKAPAMAAKPVSKAPAALKAAHVKAHAAKAEPAAKPVAAAIHAAPKAAPAPQAATPRPVVTPRPVSTGTTAAAATRPVHAPAPAAALPRDVLDKAAIAKQLEAAEAKKKPFNSTQRHGFKVGEYVVYPSHGVGKIMAIEEQVVAGHALELFVINFEQEKMTLRVPTAKLAAVGMRKLAEDGVVRRAMDTLRGRARVKRTMWSRRAQEYENKINSGDLVSISEVVRDLYRAETQPEQSYSERQLFEAALDRMSREIAAVEKLDERGAVQKITEVLSKSAKGRATKATEDAAAAAAAGDAEERAA